MGDYVLGLGLAVERKGSADLAASIRDGRIFDQAVRLQSAFAQAVLMVEGEPRGITEDAWRGAVCRLVEDGFTVLHSLDAEDSAAGIIRLAKRARRGRADHPHRRSAPGAAPPVRAGRGDALRGPGHQHHNGPQPARRPRQYRRGRRGCARGLRRHPGIGRVRAARLAEALRGVYVAPVDREPEPGRPARGEQRARRWIVTGPGRTAEPESFDRRSIALRALRSAADGARLIDSLTGEVLEADAGLGSR